jgi:hypothetical protein
MSGVGGKLCAGNPAASISVYAALRRDRPRSSAAKLIFSISEKIELRGHSNPTSRSGYAQSHRHDTHKKLLRFPENDTLTA